MHFLLPSLLATNWIWPPNNFHLLGWPSMAGDRRSSPAIFAGGHRLPFLPAVKLGSKWLLQIEMNLDPLGLGVFNTHFKNFMSENLDLHFWYVVSKAVSSALRLAPTFLSPRSTWISIIQAPKPDCIYIQSGFGARIIIQAPKADPKFIIDFYIYSLVSEPE